MKHLIFKKENVNSNINNSDVAIIKILKCIIYNKELKIDLSDYSYPNNQFEKFIQTQAILSCYLILKEKKIKPKIEEIYYNSQFNFNLYIKFNMFKLLLLPLSSIITLTEISYYFNVIKFLFYLYSDDNQENIKCIDVLNKLKSICYYLSNLKVKKDINKIKIIVLLQKLYVENALLKLK